MIPLDETIGKGETEGSLREGIVWRRILYIILE
jgi:hypothetical protein